MKELPELKSHYAGMSKGYVIRRKKGDFPFTTSEAGEIVRRCKAYEELVKLKQASIKFQCDHCNEWLTVTVQEIIGSDRVLEQALPKPPCPSCKGSGLKTDENGVVEDDVCPECDGEKKR
ncbi:hypothetical protein LCGC14_2274060 [marine sediment metagenome]|uniref:Uncharacterized protein n=1 Tax=marine sediment metagenome TaxID=412755 RepID=A0A0F9CW37_9ZZZZ